MTCQAWRVLRRPACRAAALARNEGRQSSFDLGRGCPFQCSFCTIINVQGRKSRFRNADDLEAIVRENLKQGITSFFITDDNMARNKHWEDFFDRLIELEENEGIAVSLIIQVDTQCHRIPNFIHKARWAGVYRVFIGLENVNPDNLLAAKKRQNKITEYRKMLQAWHTSGASTWAGYILGFPGDTRESILRDMEIIKKELPLDILELFILTPLPGSEDHQTLWKQGVWMDPDLNKYDVHHRVVHHPRMSDAEYEQTYRDAWKSYYTPEHIETVARRHGAIPGRNPVEPVRFMTMFKIMFEAEGIHPLEGGIVRMKYRRDRRHGLKIEPVGVFHYKLARRDLAEAQDLRAAGLAGLAHRPEGQERPQAPRIHRSRPRAGGRGGYRQARPVRRDGGRRGRGHQEARRGCRCAPRSPPGTTCSGSPPNRRARPAAGALEIVQDDAQQGAVDLQAAVVVDEAQLPKLVHEGVDARAGRADDLGQRLLADLRVIACGAPSLPKLARRRSVRARRFSLELNSWSTRSSSTRLLRVSRCAMKSSPKAGSACRTRIISAFLTRMTSLLVTALAVARRRGWPIRQPSPKNSPGLRMATTASRPCLDVTTTLILPLRI